jgi:hypothetical protein
MQRYPTMKRQERRCKRNILNTKFSVVELLLGEFEPMRAATTQNIYPTCRIVRMPISVLLLSIASVMIPPLGSC